jgi:hypothetical protein
VGDITQAWREHLAAADISTPDERARDEANIAVRGALARMGRAAGVTFTDQPIFEGAGTTEQVMDPAAAIRMCLILRSTADFQLRESVRRARGEGLGWAQIGEALNLQADESRGIPLAEVAYEYAAAGHIRTSGRLSFYWTCTTCGQHVTDRGPYEAHPLDNEDGHAGSCARMAAAVAEHAARWGDED